MNLTDREYSNLSDFLFDHAKQIRAEYLGPCADDTDYTVYAPEIQLLLAVMDAVRVLPGLDKFDPPSMFDRDLHRALAAYHVARLQAAAMHAEPARVRQQALTPSSATPAS
jgi:hypothetical protein